MLLAVRCLAAGLLWQALLWLLPETTPLIVVALASATAMLPPLWLATRLSGVSVPWMPLLIATPYPFRLALDLYSERGVLLPDALASAVSSPTGFYLWMAAILLPSVPWTLYWLGRALPEDRQDVPDTRERLRRASLLLYFLTGVAVLIPLPEWGLKLLRYGPALLAVPVYAAVYGYARSAPLTPSATGRMLPSI